MIWFLSVLLMCAFCVIALMFAMIKTPVDPGPGVILIPGTKMPVSDLECLMFMFDHGAKIERHGDAYIMRCGNSVVSVRFNYQHGHVAAWFNQFLIPASQAIWKDLYAHEGNGKA